VEADEGQFIGGTRPAVEQQAGALRIEFRLDEQLPEGGVRQIVLRA
jgi:hypothetical protein